MVYTIGLAIGTFKSLGQNRGRGSNEFESRGSKEVGRKVENNISQDGCIGHPFNPRFLLG